MTAIPQRIRPAGPNGDATHAMFTDDGLALVVALGDVPSHSPYQPGDWVRYHGHAGGLPGPQRWGWRGYVLGGMGSTLLRGVTDEGREWCEHWGALLPDGKPPVHWEHCTCCPHPDRLRPRRPEQLNLFDLIGQAA